MHTGPNSNYVAPAIARIAEPPRPEIIVPWLSSLLYDLKDYCSSEVDVLTRGGFDVQELAKLKALSRSYGDLSRICGVSQTR